MDDFYNFMRAGQLTRRYHTTPVIHTQTVAEHSHGVALIAGWLAAAEPPGMSGALLMAALIHDLAEHKMGDIPSPVKKRLPRYGALSFSEVWDEEEDKLLVAAGLPWMQQLTERELRILKIADAADGCFYCIRERAMGNKMITECFGNYRGYVLSLIDADKPEERELALYINNEWSKADVS